MEQEDKKITVNSFLSFLKNEILGAEITNCYIIGNSFSIIFENLSLEVSPAWRFLKKRKILVGSADIGWEEDSWSDEEINASNSIKEIASSLIGVKLEKIELGKLHDMRLLFSEKGELQSFISSTSDYGNVIIRNKESTTTHVLGANFIIRTREARAG